MDGILAQLLAFPPHPQPAAPLSDGEYDRQAKNHVQNLDRIPPSNLLNSTSSDGDVLDVSTGLNAQSFLAFDGY